MDLFYRVLGVAASLAHWANRQRVNGIPSSIGPLAGWIILPVFLLGGLMDLGADKNPHPLSVAEIVEAREVAPYDWVTLSGRYHPDFALKSELATASDSSSSTTESDEQVYVAFIDPAAHAAVMVQMSPAEAQGLTTKPTTVTGVLRYGEPPLRKLLPPKLLGLPLSHFQYLEAGAVPYQTGSFAVVAGVLLIPLSLYTAALLMGSIIFRRERRLDPGTPPPLPSGDVSHGADIRATGQFHLQERVKERFLQVPATLVRLDDGGLGVYANVDASVQHALYFIPISKEERAGSWLLWIAAGTVRNVELGTQYLAWERRPAIRCRFETPYSRGLSTLFLSFDSEQSRSMVLTELLRQVRA